MRAGQDVCFLCGRMYRLDEMAPGSAQVKGKDVRPINLCGGCQLVLRAGRNAVVTVDGKRVRVWKNGAV